MQRSFLILLSIVILAGCSLEDLHRSDKPLSRVEASKYVSLPLPSSARDIYYVYHADGLQEFQEFVRFTVDADEMTSTVDALLSGHTNSPPVYDSDVEKSFQPMTWWTPTSIVHGEHRTADKQPIYIWTDIDNNIIFVCRHD